MTCSISPAPARARSSFTSRALTRTRLPAAHLPARPRISPGKIRLPLRRTDAHAIAREALNIAKSDIHRKGLRVTTHWAAREHHVWADPVRLEQVFWNLINNAVKFTPPGGEIRISTANEHGRFR